MFMVQGSGLRVWEVDESVNMSVADENLPTRVIASSV